jgi:hypothetical protein
MSTPRIILTEDELMAQPNFLALVDKEMENISALKHTIIIQRRVIAETKQEIANVRYCITYAN